MAEGGDVATLRLARLVDLKDAGTQAHSRRVALMAYRLSFELGFTPVDCERIRRAAQVHDVGKIGISETILQKPDRLTPDEYRVIKTHPATGVTLLANHAFDDEQREWVLHHHERPDGLGYPDGLTIEQLSDGAAIICLADCWDVMISERPYKAPMPVAEAVREVQRNCNKQFLHHVVSALERVLVPEWSVRA